MGVGKVMTLLTDPDNFIKLPSDLVNRRHSRKRWENSLEADATFSGYMAPEYAMRGQFSAKSDIFNFGVLVLEILTGRKNRNFLETEQAEDPAKLCMGTLDPRNNLRDTRPISWRSMAKK
ncbi:hypothetical protein J5N97_011599 [Dioscorea zingiberensis]|uniref:Serine-threonine/tyrosine-protein kinase catalytic domain-containing protein n=1 Tax=Dioscorea zingiberensis TaxID=325984 RepID=A0A9D5HNN7_9LILI|nr:hypothetical protein J5N97_011599 [Dioscorea zingiberensis]